MKVGEVMIKKCIMLRQNEFNMYLISLNVIELIMNTTVEYFDSTNNEGYQRPLVTAHYRKIARYLQENDKSILPPAILAAVDPTQISPNGDKIDIKGQMRIVDGQHRIEGIRYLKQIDSEAYNRIINYEFPVILMVISKTNRIHEINTFININSLGKKVKTDLAVQLKEKIRKSVGFGDYNNLKEIINSIATQISEELNKSKDCVWSNNIRLGDDNSIIKPISINSFNRSIIRIIDNYIKFKPKPSNESDILKYKNEIGYIIKESWQAIAKRWNKCFIENSVNSKYNIQKGIGVFPLNILISDAVKECEGDISKTLKSFNDVITCSNVKNEDWIIGGKFSPLNSQAGFQVITQILKNINVDIW